MTPPPRFMQDCYLGGVLIRRPFGLILRRAPVFMICRKINRRVRLVAIDSEVTARGLAPQTARARKIETLKLETSVTEENIPEDQSV